MSVKLMAIVWELDLPPGEKLVLLALADQANDAGTQCWPSVDTIAKRSGQGERTVRRALASLEQQGHLTRQHRDGTSTQYRVHPCQFGTPAETAPLPKTTKTPAKLAPKPPRTINNGLSNDKPKRVTAPVPRPQGVSEQTWADFVTTRKARRAPITVTVVKQIAAEAARAMWLLEDAYAEIVARGWQSFKAEWVSKDGRADKVIRGSGGGSADKRSGLARAIDRELGSLRPLPEVPALVGGHAAEEGW